MKKIIKRLLGSDTPKRGHWLDSLREAPTQVPATTEPNTSGLERMLNQPIDRRTFMERTGQAAQAASTMNRLGGALEGLVPRAVEASPSPDWSMGGVELIDNLFDQVPDRVWARFQNTWDEAPLTSEELVRVFPNLQEVRINENSEDPLMDLVKFLRNEAKDDEGKMEYVETFEKQLEEIRGGPPERMGDH